MFLAPGRAAGLTGGMVAPTATAAIRLARLLARQGYRVRLRRCRPRRGPGFWLVERAPARRVRGSE